MRRIVVRLMVSLMVGVVVTVLVAWGALLRGYSSHSNGMRANTPWPIAVPSTWPREATAIQCHLGRGRDLTLYINNENGWPGPLTNVPDPKNRWVSALRIGWPFRALTRYVAVELAPGRLSNPDLGVWRSGLVIPSSWTMVRRRIVDQVPILPLWPGFLANTLFYASVPWLLMFGVATLIRRRRIRRGLCIQCAYPISGLSVCPECGRAVRSAEHEPSNAIEPEAVTPV